MKIIDFEMIKNLNLSTDEYMEWTKQVFLDKKNCQLPPKITIKKEAVDPEDVEMLQDLILTCINEALRKVDAASASEFGKYNIPGLM